MQKGEGIPAHTIGCVQIRELEFRDRLSFIMGNKPVWTLPRGRYYFLFLLLFSPSPSSLSPPPSLSSSFLRHYLLILDSKLICPLLQRETLSQSSKAVCYTNILKKTVLKSSVHKTCRNTRLMENCLPTTSILHFYTVLAFGKFSREYATPLATSVHLTDRG